MSAHPVKTSSLSEEDGSTVAKVQSSRLLHLPGELRNHIFSFIIPYARPARNPNLSGSLLTMRYARSELFPTLQTCQQLRTEFKSFLSMHIEFRVKLLHMSQICEEWVLRGGVDGDATKAYGNFSISTVSHGNTVDLLPMLRTYLEANATEKKMNFCFWYPQMESTAVGPFRHCAYVEELGVFTKMLKKLFDNVYVDKNHPGKWRNFVATHVKSLFIHLEGERRAVNFVVDKNWLYDMKRKAENEDIYHCSVYGTEDVMPIDPDKSSDSEKKRVSMNAAKSKIMFF
ncbi:hypothetical protein T440DRAFT_521969 [Plenodomus tracheiphilus IPT5]|uniref:F-box domain-containing protein n=1 Tax=Plenodomus tracheiphilus IPT5 TaxID=1408161 RepID=A0A6A7ASB8_9PLEO|nr:hypothetical protein T440DRAFT_521969 [Plenodomus tracheiphilus IPT5]